MGYLNISSISVPDFSRAVISLWFRVPQASIDAVTADYNVRTGSEEFQFVGLLPLLTFGKLGTRRFVSVGHDFTSNTYTSFVGVRCDGGDSNNNGGSGASLQVYLNYDSGGSTSLKPNNDIPPEDIGTIQSDFFCVGGYMEGAWELGGPSQTASYIDVTPDLWHHALISFDVSSECSLTYGADTPITFNGNCQFWWAFDDVNYNGDYLNPYNPRCVSGGVGGDNQIVSAICTSAGDGSYSFAAGPIPVSGQPIGLPSSSGYEQYVYHCEMAELQMFTGVTLDTGVTANRRAFIDANGKPVPPDDPHGSIALLGQPPDIALIGNQNWIAGTNTGSSGGASGANFTPTGDIKAYTPNAALGS